MALIQCPECGNQVSTAAKSCPNCGFPVAEKAAQPAAMATAAPGTVLAEVRPSWWGYFWYLFFFWLIIPPFVAFFKRAATRLEIYPERIHLERGLFSKSYRDLNPHDIRAIDIEQSFLQRMVGIGNLSISTAATIESDEEINSIPDPKAIRDLILAQRPSAQSSA
jgi:uncharacterized membrane protein YdbT with pleckstrin-like domain